jgi:hypothetical protein
MREDNDRNVERIEGEAARQVLRPRRRQCWEFGDKTERREQAQRACRRPRLGSIGQKARQSDARVSRELIAAGMPGYTPAAAIASGTTPAQRTVLTTVADLPDCVRNERLEAPTLFVIGDVVELADTLAWASAVTECALAARA